MSKKSVADKLVEMPLDAKSDPVVVHAEEVDIGGLDMATLAHMTAKTVCNRLGEPCGCQGNLPEGLCIADMSPCKFAREGGSGKPYASDSDSGPESASQKTAEPSKTKSPRKKRAPRKKTPTETK